MRKNCRCGPMWYSVVVGRTARRRSHCMFLTDEVVMWSLIITTIAIASIATLYVGAVYVWREQRDARTNDDELQIGRPMPIEGSDWELEYLLTSDYARN